MNWLIPALLAPAIFTSVSFIDKYIVEKEVKDYRGMPIYYTIVGLLAGITFWVFTGFPVLPTQDTCILLATGVITIWAAALYYKAISVDETSRLILLFQMTPVMILILSFLVFGERISWRQLLGFLFITSAVVGVSDQFTHKGFRISQSFWMILVVDFLWALSAVLVKFSISGTSLTSVLIYESWGIGIGGIILYSFFPQIRVSFHESIKGIRRTTLLVVVGNEGLNIFGKSLTFFAYSLGSASLVSIVGSTQVFMGILFGVLFTLWASNIVREDISRNRLMRKVLLCCVLFFGLVLVV